MIVETDLIEFRRVHAIEPVGDPGNLERGAVLDGRIGGQGRIRREKQSQHHDHRTHRRQEPAEIEIHHDFHSPLQRHILRMRAPTSMRGPWLAACAAGLAAASGQVVCSNSRSRADGMNRVRAA